MVKHLVTIRPGPVMKVWDNGQEVAEIPLSPRAALTLAQDLIRAAMEKAL